MTCAHTDSPRNQIHLDHLSHRDLGGWHVQSVLRNELRFRLSDKLVLSPARPLMMAMRMLVLGVCTRMDVSCRLSPVCSPESCASAVGEPLRTDTASARHVAHLYLLRLVLVQLETHPRVAGLQRGCAREV
jgi:hypothetical protein